MSNDKLYDEALETIKELSRDASASPEETQYSLESLIEEIENLIDALKEN